MRRQSAIILECESDLQFLHRRYTYSAESPSGLIRNNTSGKFLAGSPCGTKGPRGVWRLLFSYKGKLIAIGAHRVVFILKTGAKIPVGMVVDHMDGNPSNNRFENLQLLTSSQNSRARNRKPKQNTSGFMGVSWHRARRKWVAMMRRNNVPINIGIFKTPKEAAIAYNFAARKWAQENNESPRFLNPV